MIPSGGLLQAAVSLALVKLSKLQCTTGDGKGHRLAAAQPSANCPAAAQGETRAVWRQTQRCRLALVGGTARDGAQGTGETGQPAHSQRMHRRWAVQESSAGGGGVLI